MQVKNRGAARSRRLEQLSRLSQHRIMLTGTPLQNNLGELYNLLRFLLPSLFQKLPPLPPAQAGPAACAFVPLRQWPWAPSELESHNTMLHIRMC